MGFGLGEKVRVKARIIPVKVYYREGGILRKWERREVGAEGVIAGVRTVQEGISEYRYEGRWIFEPRRYIKTYLIAVKLSEMWHVLPEDIEVIQGEITDESA